MKSGELQKLVKNPAAYMIEYRDGLKATMLMLDGAIKDFNFAARLKGSDQPLVDPVPAHSRAERHLLGVPDEQSRANVRDAASRPTRSSGRCS